MSIARVVSFKFTVETRDVTFENVTVAFWSCVETNATIAIACFMTMKPLLVKWFPTFAAFRSRNPDGRRHSEAVDDASSRPPTIGSKPSRPSPHPRQLARALTRLSPGSPTAFEMDCQHGLYHSLADSDQVFTDKPHLIREAPCDIPIWFST